MKINIYKLRVSKFFLHFCSKLFICVSPSRLLSAWGAAKGGVPFCALAPPLPFPLFSFLPLCALLLPLRPTPCPIPPLPASLSYPLLPSPFPPPSPFSSSSVPLLPPFPPPASRLPSLPFLLRLELGTRGKRGGAAARR